MSDSAPCPSRDYFPAVVADRPATVMAFTRPAAGAPTLCDVVFACVTAERVAA